MGADDVLCLRREILAAAADREAQGAALIQMNGSHSLSSGLSWRARARWTIERDTLLVIVIVETCVLLLSVGLPTFLYAGSKVVGTGIRKAIEAFDTSIFGTEIEIGEILPDVFQGFVKIDNLIIKNPTLKNEYQSEYLMKVDQFLVDVDMQKLIFSFGKQVHIEKLELVGLDIIVEKCSGSSNVQDILDHLQQLMPEEVDKDKDDAEKKKEEEKKHEKEEENNKKIEEEKGKLPEAKAKVTLDKVIVRDVAARVKVQQLCNFQVFNLNVSDIEIDDFQKNYVSSDGAISPILLVGIVMNTLLKSTLAAIVGKQMAERLM